MANSGNDDKKFTAEDFQRKLLEWFDSRGMLSELRSYMRHQMIAALSNSGSSGPCPTARFTVHTQVSPMLQALLLLVAEFLVQQEYHYTVSVMIAEVPLLASFPKFADYVNFMSKPSSPTKSKPPQFPHYSQQDVSEILNSLGIAQESESSHHIRRLYSNSSTRECLLACVLTALPAVAQQHALLIANHSHTSIEVTRSKTDDIKDSSTWIEEIRLLLLRVPLTSSQLQQLEDLLLRFYSNTVSRVREEEEIKRNNLLQLHDQQLRVEGTRREEQFRSLMAQAEEDIEKKRLNLEQVAIQLRKQHDEVLSRLNRVQKHSEDLKQQEDDLNNREISIQEKLKSIEEEHRVLADLRADLQEAARTLRQDQTESKAAVELRALQERCLRLETELEVTRAQLKPTTFDRANLVSKAIEAGIQTARSLRSESVEAGRHQITSPNDFHSPASSICSFSHGNTPSKSCQEKQRDKNNQISLLKKVLRRVQQENTELRAVSAQQRRRIQELTTRAAHLAASLAARDSTQGLHHFNAPATSSQIPPPLPPPMPNRASYGNHLGAGEEPPRHVLHSPHTVRVHGREWRRKPPKRLIQHVQNSTSFSSDDSPTDEVVRDSRSRLRRLDEESEALDRSLLEDFRIRQSASLAASASVLFVPTNQQTAVPSSPTVQSFDSHRISPNLPTTYSSFMNRTNATVPLANRPGMNLNPSRLLSSPLIRQRSQFTYPERSGSLAMFARDPEIQRNSYPGCLPQRPDRNRDLLNAKLGILKDFTQDVRRPTGDFYQGRTYNFENRDSISQNGHLSPSRRDFDVNTADSANVFNPERVNFSPERRDFDNVEIIKTAEGLRELNLKQSHGLLEKVEEILSNSSRYANKVPSEVKLQTKIQEEEMESDKTMTPEEKNDVDSPVIEPQAKAELSVAGDELDLDGEKLGDKKGSERDLKMAPKQLPLTIESTLNEVSSLSSSPALSDQPKSGEKSPKNHSSEQESKENSDEKMIRPTLDVRYNILTSTRIGDDVQAASVQEAVVPTGLVYQLQNATVSSIENASDQAISVGSDGRKGNGQDDDDFW